MQMPTTPFGALHFALRFWLTQPPSRQRTAPKRESVRPARKYVAVFLHQANIGVARRTLFAAVTLGALSSGRSLRTGWSERPEFTPRAVGAALAGGALWALRPGRSNLPGRALRSLEATRQQQQRRKCDEEPGLSHSIALP